MNMVSCLFVFRFKRGGRASCAAMNRNFLPLVFLCLAFCAGAAHAAFINGQNYVPLADWAGANGFKSFWLSRTEIVLTNKSSRLVFGGVRWIRRRRKSTA